MEGEANKSGKVRYVVVWVPNWSLSSLVVQVPPSAPAAVFKTGKVEAVTPAGQRCGVSLGMSQKMAHYLCANLLTVPHDPERDKAAFETVLEVFDEHAAGVVAVRPGVAFAPAHSAAKWAGSEQTLAANLVEDIAVQTGVECQVGIADSLSAALLASRLGVIIPSLHTERFLSDQSLRALVREIPTEHLNLVNETLQTLRTLGVTTVAQMQNLGADAVVNRFGVAGQFLWDLGKGKDPLVSLDERTNAEVGVELVLDPPTANVEHSFLAIRRVSAALADKLVQRGLQSSTLKIELRQVSGRTSHRTWTLLDVTSSAEIAKRLTWQIRGFAEKLQQDNLSQRHGDGLQEVEDSGALQAIQLTALYPRSEPEYEPLWGGNQSLQLASKAVSEVQAMLGEKAVNVPTVHGGFDPLTRVSLTPWGGEQKELPPRVGAWEGGVSPSPAVVFSKPSPVLLLGSTFSDEKGRNTQDDEVKVDGRGNLNGKPEHILVQRGHPELPEGHYPLTGVRGVWPIRGRWWQKQDGRHRSRCYLRVGRKQGTDLLLVQRRGRWYVEGIYSKTKAAVG